ncbi:SRR1 family protein [Schizosaccharomyces japonicus yFS275]|uniref:SRR1 family protein n=1 Tax=Schizosaccharomyces japonicus (strain yFS275 / FY16936) TaxID=402676 RepID=B6JZM7_SCHJY|nr:SRR1 family protein [Schizosaccharomyces japonicus yFS275]EEB06995.1 SRR1 family protein [Schizosaccharomyces japonicus yFS275]
MDFVVVTRSNKRCLRRKKGQLNSCSPTAQSSRNKNDIEIWTTQKLKEKLQRVDELLENSKFWKQLSPNFTEKVQDVIPTRNHCLVLGLGRIHTTTASLQLSLLLKIIRIFEIKETNVRFYDPVFEKDDISFLEEFGFEVLKHSPKTEKLEDTLLYMPHCPTNLYEQWVSVFQPDWSDFVLCGNDLSMYVDTRPSKEVKAQYPTIFEVCSNNVFDKICFPKFEEVYAFNDLALQFWKGLPEKQSTS